MHFDRPNRPHLSKNSIVRAVASFKPRILNAIALRYTALSLVKLVLVRCGIPLTRTTEKNKEIIKASVPQIAHVISLPFRTDRRQQIGELLKECGVNYSVHDASHGRQILHSIDHAKISPQSIRHLSSGSIGAIVSHIELWEELATHYDDNFLVFEDDAMPIKYFVSELLELWKAVPGNYDILILGSGLTIFNDLKEQISTTIYVPYFPRRGLYSYVISKNGISKILKCIYPVTITCGGIDTLIGNMIRLQQINGFHANPAICFHDSNSVSNIFNISQPLKSLHKTEMP